MITISTVVFLALARHNSSQFNFLVLQNVHEHDSRHVGVIGCLVIVRKQGLTLVVAALILGVEAPAQISLEFVIICTLFVHLTERSVVEGT